MKRDASKAARIICPTHVAHEEIFADNEMVVGPGQGIPSYEKTCDMPKC